MVKTIDGPVARRRLRTGAVLAVAAVAAGSLALGSRTASEAAPGDPLTSFGSGGTLTVSLTSGCGTACPGPGSGTSAWEVHRAGSRTTTGFQWDGTPSEVGAVPVGGVVVALHDGGTAPAWTRHVTAGTPDGGLMVELLDVGWDPAAQHVLVAVAISDPAGSGGQATPLRQEVRRYGVTGTAAGTTTFDAAAHGWWSDVAFAGDGSLAVVVDGAGADDLPQTTVRRYGTGTALAWQAPLPLGAAVEQVEVADDGGVLIAGTVAPGTAAEYDGLLARLTPAGSLDPGFDGDGTFVSSGGDGLGRAFLDVDQAGSVIAAVGSDQWEATDLAAEEVEEPGALVVARFSGGALDAGFGSGGLVVDPHGPDGSDSRTAAAVLVDGPSVVVAGSAAEVSGAMRTPWMERYGPDGLPDGTFEVSVGSGGGFTTAEAVDGGYLVTSEWTSPASPLTAAVRAFRSHDPLPTPATPVPARDAQGRLVVTWAAVAGASAYDLLVDTGGDGTVDETITTTGRTAVPPAPGGQVHRFAVVARSATTTSARSPWTAATVAPFASIDAFTDRQYRDLALRPATASEKQAWRTALTNRSTTPPALVSQAIDLPAWAPKQSPAVRLYRAYFLRDPDLGGLRFWVDRMRSGTRLDHVSSAFAASSEFQRRYGDLSNRAFVELVYRNVLGRDGEPTGVTFWASQLDQGLRTRGRVMTGFSESSEYRRKTDPRVDVVNVYTGLLGRMPAGDEMAEWEPRLAGGTSRTALIAALLDTAAYASRTK